MTRPITDRGRLNPDCPAGWHGTYSAYRHGCRCPHAREDHRLHQKRQREQRAPVVHLNNVGTRRRVQALAALGWRWQDIAARTGTSYQSVQRLALLDQAVHVATVERIRAVYDQLSATPGPSELTRRRAAAKGWVPPLAWDDDTIDDPNALPNLGGPSTDAIDPIAVDRAVQGDRSVRLSRVECRAAVEQLEHRGWSAKQIGRHLGTTSRTVQRQRARRRTTQQEVPAA